MNALPPERRKVPASLSLTPELIARLDEYAASQGRSRSNLAEYILRDRLGMMGDGRGK